MDIFQNEVKIKELLDKIQLSNEDLEWLKKRGLELETKINDLTEQSDKLLRQIASSGYDDLKNQLISLNMLIERLVKSKVSWEQTANHLKVWIGQDVVTNQIHHDIEKFINCGISKDELNRLRKDLVAVQNDIKNQQQEAMAVIRDLRKNEQQLKEELDQLKSGNKAYPKELEMARLYIQRRLSEEHGEYVQVEILADLLDIRDDKWRNAVEGYMANNKLALIVEPKYARDALRIYGGMDKEKYHRIAILDTEKVGQNSHKVLQNALAEEVTVERSFIQPYIHFLLGKVMKCKDIDELRNCKIGITTDCVLYHSYRMQHINPDHYTRFAYIGKNSLRQRIQLLENNLETIQIQLKPQETIIKECKEIQSFESLIYDARVYLDWQQDIVDCKEKEREQQELRTKLEILKVESVDAWEKERQTVQQDIKRKTDELRQNYITTSDRKKT